MSGRYSIADILIMKYANHGRTLVQGGLDKGNDGFAVGGIQRRGRLVEQKDGIFPNETASNIDPLLLAA